MRARPAPSNRTVSAPVPERIVAPALAAQRQRNRAVREHALAVIARFDVTSANGSTPRNDSQIPLGIVPLQERDITALPTETRERFLTRLEGRLRDAFELHPAAAAAAASLSDEEPTTPHVETLMGTGCAMCRGACCTRGSDHAFLGVDSLSRVRGEHTGDTAESLLATYIAHLPAEHFVDSCVYHAVDGCTLPRALRSNTCNRYRCGGLTQLRRALEASEHASAFIGASDNQSLRTLAFVTASHAHPIDLTDATGS